MSHSLPPFVIFFPALAIGCGTLDAAPDARIDAVADDLGRETEQITLEDVSGEPGAPYVHAMTIPEGATMLDIGAYPDVDAGEAVWVEVTRGSDVLCSGAPTETTPAQPWCVLQDPAPGDIEVHVASDAAFRDWNLFILVAGDAPPNAAELPDWEEAVAVAVGLESGQPASEERAFTLLEDAAALRVWAGATDGAVASGAITLSLGSGDETLCRTQGDVATDTVECWLPDATAGTYWVRLEGASYSGVTLGWQFAAAPPEIEDGWETVGDVMIAPGTPVELHLGDGQDIRYTFQATKVEHTLGTTGTGDVDVRVPGVTCPYTEGTSTESCTLATEPGEWVTFVVLGYAPSDVVVRVD